jgi:hypothetical protein
MLRLRDGYLNLGYYPLPSYRLPRAALLRSGTLADASNIIWPYLEDSGP